MKHQYSPQSGDARASNDLSKLLSMFQDSALVVKLDSWIHRLCDQKQQTLMFTKGTVVCVKILGRLSLLFELACKVDKALDFEFT